MRGSPEGGGGRSLDGGREAPRGFPKDILRGDLGNWQGLG